MDQGSARERLRSNDSISQKDARPEPGIRFVCAHHRKQLPPQLFKKALDRRCRQPLVGVVDHWIGHVGRQTTVVCIARSAKRRNSSPILQSLAKPRGNRYAHQLSAIPCGSARRLLFRVTGSSNNEGPPDAVLGAHACVLPRRSELLAQSMAQYSWPDRPTCTPIRWLFSAAMYSISSLRASFERGSLLRGPALGAIPNASLFATETHRACLTLFPRCPQRVGRPLASVVIALQEVWSR
jgi:hypothetical protein